MFIIDRTYIFAMIITVIIRRSKYGGEREGISF